ncbi:hypothetical protein WICMUC_001358 [Wickerhamomyces mucosus]|uniref:protein-tyrosine-phosphatase n=1 Tax=Wickerhamomyces mucosus TaxID=1378264 RepID=A0A9P8PWA6_9ASCO|nr:hypothetical protein WICMUC_001358 [Wickerhamomyces mucosus]
MIRNNFVFPDSYDSKNNTSKVMMNSIIKEEEEEETTFDNDVDFINKTNEQFSHINLNNDSYNSINSIDSSNSPGNSMYSFKLKRFNSTSSINSTTNPFANFESQVISPTNLFFKNSSSSSISTTPSSPSPSLNKSSTSPQILPHHHTHSQNHSISSISFHKKQYSNSSITSSNSLKSPSNKKFTKFPIQDRVELIENGKLESLIPTTNLLIIDVRSYLEFNKNHIKGSINFNLPTTLLKRSNFNLTKCLNNISPAEKSKLFEFLESSTVNHSKILIYDDFKIINNEIPLKIYGTINKFIEYDYNGDILILSNGFQSLQNDYPHLTQPLKDDEEIKSKPKFVNNRSLSLVNLPTLQALNLSNFSLPDKNTNDAGCGTFNFKIRHNEEIMDYDNDSRILDDFKQLSSNLSHPSEALPIWFQNLLNLPKQSLLNNFKTLEINEKNYINKLIRSNSLSSGIELGYKNRYKDIFPYEHSRVRLNDDLYINANHLNCHQILTNIRLDYIATQAPLLSTVSDFCQVLNDFKTNLIISLTNEFENGVEKCFPFWNQSSEIKSIDSFKLSENILIRKLSINNESVFQFQVLEWFDFDVIQECQKSDLLKLIFLKRELTSKGLINELTLVHCSAGCGRTGTFCTIDSIINSILNSDIKFNEDQDPIFQVVKIFREQRISMVQNLRQYLFIYEFLIYFFEIQKTNDGLLLDSMDLRFFQ